MCSCGHEPIMTRRIMQWSTPQMVLNHRTSCSSIQLSATKEEHNTLPNGQGTLWGVCSRNIPQIPVPQLPNVGDLQKVRTTTSFQIIFVSVLVKSSFTAWRKSSRKKYTEDDILTKDATTGKFTIQGSGRVHTIDFGVCIGEPSCTCLDSLQWHIPCKYFFSILRLVEGWGWNALPDQYKKSAYLCADILQPYQSNTTWSHSLLLMRPLQSKATMKMSLTHYKMYCLQRR